MDQHTQECGFRPMASRCGYCGAGVETTVNHLQVSDWKLHAYPEVSGATYKPILWSKHKDIVYMHRVTMPNVFSVYFTSYGEGFVMHQFTMWIAVL